jgi:AcrR family transcriptional regulator
VHVTQDKIAPSARRVELLEAAYRYALEHGLADVSLRPLAAAVGSSPRVLLFLFGSKDGLVRALLQRARAEEVGLLERMQLDAGSAPPGLDAAAEQLWTWLRSAEHRPLLRLWAEAYSRSLVEPEGAWAGFARSTVEDWLALLSSCQTPEDRDSGDGVAQRTLTLAILRGCLLDLLATSEDTRVDAAAHFAFRTNDVESR